MRKLLVFCTFLLLVVLSGCSSSTPVVQILPDQSVKMYYSALSKGDYNQAADLLSANNLKLANISREQWIANFKEADYKKSVKWIDYQISEIKDIDSVHKRVKVLYKQNIQGKEISGTDDFLLAQENEKWLLDFTMVLSSAPIAGEKSVNTNGGTINISNIIAHKTVDGILLTCSISNHTANTLQAGWADAAIFELTTDKGDWSVEMNSREKVYAEKTETASFKFSNADGIPQAFTMKGIRFLDDRGLPINRGESQKLSFQL